MERPSSASPTDTVETSLQKNVILGLGERRTIKYLIIRSPTLEPCAGVVELVDALDSKSSSERSVGSIPTARTIFPKFLPNLTRGRHLFCRGRT